MSKTQCCCQIYRNR